MDHSGNTQRRLHGGLNASLRLLNLTHGVGKQLFRHFNINLHNVEVILARDNNLIVRLHSQLQYNMFYLRWEDIHAANDKHII